MTTPLRPATPGRADRPPPSTAARVGTWTAAVLFGLAIAYGVLVLFERYGPGDANPRVLGYDIRSDSEIEIVFDVTKDPDVKAVCLVRSRALDLSEAGHDDVVVPRSPAGKRTTVIRHTLQTTSRAQTGEVLRCQALAPGEPLPTHVEPTPQPTAQPS